jgi:hypothetical protein
LDSAHQIEEESTILVTDTFCVLTSVISETGFAYNRLMAAETGLARSIAEKPCKCSAGVMANWDCQVTSHCSSFCFSQVAGTPS